MREVTISMDKYERLMNSESLLLMILNACYEEARLNYNKEKLSLSTSEIDNIVRYGDAIRYRAVFERLTEEDKKKQEETDGTDHD